MPARGRHRRYRPGPVSRASLTVTASGAGLALPLVTAGVGHAAPEEADRAPQAVQSAHTPHDTPLPHLTRAAATAETGETGETGETVRSARSAPSVQGGRAGKDDPVPAEDAAYQVAGGDTLSSIARDHAVDDGWQGLYERNRRVVGGDPDLILPGQRLSLEEGPAAQEPRQRPQQKAEPEPAEQGGDGEDSAPAERPEPAEDSAAPPKEKEKERAEDPEPVPAAPRASAPVSGVQTGTQYRVSGSGWSSGYHTGVDFPVPTGTTVKAVSGGSVTSAGWAGAYGYQVVLRHDDGRYSQYAHLSAISVSEGQRVGAGQRVGRSGSTGNSTGPHLHFEVRTGPGYGSDIDPLAYLRALGVSV